MQARGRPKHHTSSGTPVPSRRDSRGDGACSAEEPENLSWSTRAFPVVVRLLRKDVHAWTNGVRFHMHCPIKELGRYGLDARSTNSETSREHTPRRSSATQAGEVVPFGGMGAGRMTGDFPMPGRRRRGTEVTWLKGSDARDPAETKKLGAEYATE